MKVITTVHKAGFDKYGSKWVEASSNWPDEDELWMYTEGFDLDHPRIRTKRVEELPKLEAFKARYRNYKPVSWEWDVVRWSNKAYTIYDAFRDHKGLGLWLDADAITYKKPPDGYIANLLPEHYYIALFKRVGMAPETGFWLINCNHAEHTRFIDTWIRWFDDDRFKELNQWCDAATMLATINAFERKKLISTFSLSGKFDRYPHPMSQVELAQYIDHMKGNRKAKGFSPENVFKKKDEEQTGEEDEREIQLSA
jgi:hypothetical protein